MTGPGQHPDFSTMAPASGSQLPDTQGTESSHSSPYEILTELVEFQTGSSQPSNSQPSQSSQGTHHGAFAKPPLPQIQPPAQSVHHHQSDITGLLNPMTPTETEAKNQVQTQPPTTMEPPIIETQPPFAIDDFLLDSLHRQLATRTSGLSVEQLEQVSAAVMDAIWRNKMNWNRNEVMTAVEKAFNETMADIEYMQEIMGPSQPENKE